MATRKPNYQVKTETSKTTNRYQDGELPAKPSGARFKGRGNYDRPTQEQIARDKRKPESKQKIYVERREKRSDKNPSVEYKSFGNGGFIGMIGSINKKK